MKKDPGAFFIWSVITAPGFGQGNNYVQNHTKFPGLALMPPVGWNSWNEFACNADENLVKQVADALVSTGMKEAGYRYLNIDHCWHGECDSLETWRKPLQATVPPHDVLMIRLKK